MPLDLPDFDDPKTRLDISMCRHEMLPWTCAPCMLEAYTALRPVALATDAYVERVVQGEAQLDKVEAVGLGIEIASAQAKLHELGFVAAVSSEAD